MAEVISGDAANDNVTSKKHGNLSPAEDFIIVREFVAMRAHVAAYGSVRQTFEAVAVKVNQNPHMTQKVTWKSVQVRYKRLQEDFNSDDQRNSGLSDVAGGETGELYQALSQMEEERESFVDKKEAAKSEKAKKEEEKELLGRKVVEMALLSKSQRSSDVDSEDGVDGDNGRDSRRVAAVGKEDQGAQESIACQGLISGLSLFADKLKNSRPFTR